MWLFKGLGKGGGMAEIHSEVPGIFSDKRCTEAIKTNFKFKLLAMKDEELDVSTEIGKQ